MVLLTHLPARAALSQLFGVNSTRDPAYMNSVAFLEYGDYQPAGHNALDFACGLGDEIYAAHDGWLDHSGDARLMPDHIADKWMHARGAAGWPSGWNALLDARDGSGTTYSHMVREAPIPDGSFVKAGTVLGWAGNTGRSTGVHLHFEYVTQLPAPFDQWLYGRRDPLQFFPAGLLLPLGMGGQGGTTPQRKLLIPGVSDLYIEN